MKLIKPSYEILPQAFGLEGIYKQIELAGRTCYKSHDKMTEDSAKGFVDRMIKSGHGAMLEHGTVYLKIPYDNIMEYADPQNPYDRDILSNPWTKYVIDYGNDVVYISSNYRWIIENNLESWLEYQCEPTEYHEIRVTVRFIIDQGIMREFTRHRTMSFACESTRYCNYSLDKFDNEVIFIIPEWCKSLQENIIEYNPFEITDEEITFCNSLHSAEMSYFNLLKNGWKPQQARNVLPLATKCELIMTGFVSDWKHFFSLRASEAGATGMHPQADELASPLYLKFKENEWI